MKKILLAALAVGVTMSAVPQADARQGCGRGYHRGPRGACRLNAGAGPVVVAPRFVIGRYYHGRGYWDGRRWYQHRERWRGGWRYR